MQRNYVLSWVAVVVTSQRSRVAGVRFDNFILQTYLLLRMRSFHFPSLFEKVFFSSRIPFVFYLILVIGGGSYVPFI